MILAQSLRQRLSGSKAIGILLILTLCLTACDAFKKVQKPTTDTRTRDRDKDDDLGTIQGNRTYDPKTGKEMVVTDVTQEMDTVRWKIADEKKNPPISNTDATTTLDPTDDPSTFDPGGEQLSQYNVVVMMPFLGNRFNSLDSEIDEKSNLALQFYGGAKLALEALAANNKNLNITVMDTEGSEAKVRSLMNRSELYNAHMIVGPVRSSNLKIVANFAKENRKVLVSPLSPSSTVAKENPFYVQVSPSLRAHCEAITRHVRDRYETDQVVLVCRNKDAEMNRLKYFQNANSRYEGSTLAKRFKEYIVTDASADFNEMDLSAYLLEDKTTVFVVPSWSNESFVYSLMHKLNLAKRDQEVVVYGMPQWMRFERIAYDYFEQLNVHVSSDTYIEMEAPKVRTFRQEFFNQFGTVPTEDAFVGYDVVNYFVDMMIKKGTRFQEVIDQYPVDNLHTSFKFEGVPIPNAQPEQKSNTVNHYENSHVNILEFKDYQFKPAR